MRICAETFLFKNFLMDFLLLLLAGRGKRFVSLTRLILAAASGAAYALAAVLYDFSFLLSVPAAFGLLLIAYPLRPWRKFAHSAAMFFVFTLLSQSTVLFAKRLSEPFALAIGGVALFLISAVVNGKRVKSSADGSIRMKITYLGRKAEFTAIVDTGNLLREPLSALPVMIADESALGKSLVRRAGTDKEARRVGYVTVAGEGSLLCVRADSMLVYENGRWVCAPDMWLGLLPGRIRAGVHALVPACAFEK